MKLFDPDRPGRAQASVLGVWLTVAAVLTWVTVACLHGIVEHRLAPHHLSDGTNIGFVKLPVGLSVYPGHSGLEVLEDGRELGPEVGDPSAVYEKGQGAYALQSDARGGYPGLYFSASDDSNPRLNGRRYVVRYPRRRLPGAAGLLVACWLGIPLAAARWFRGRMTSTASDAAPFAAGAWSVLVVGGVYALFSLQVCLHSSSIAWLLAIVAVCVPPFLESLSRHPRAFPGWVSWVAGVLSWALLTTAAGSDYASVGMGTKLVLVSAGGGVAYWGIRESLVQYGRRRWVLVVAVLGLITFLSLARAGGFDSASFLAALGLSSCATGLLTNPWTTKFIGHWLLVASWGALVALDWDRGDRRLFTALVAALAGTAIVLNGSRSAVAACLVSTVVAVVALRWPKGARRAIVIGLIVSVLAAPLVAAVPWRMFLASGGEVAGGGLLGRDLGVRGGVWEFSRRLVTVHPVRGWGVGGSSRLPGRRVSIAEALDLDPESTGPPLSKHPALAGGHPHNAALLVWLDLGLIGALLVAGLLLAIGRSIAAVEEHRGVHAALLGLLVTNAVFLALNYPAWEPEVMSILWMSAALAASVLPAPSVPRRTLRRSAAVVLVILAIGGVVLAQERLSRWLTVRDFRESEVVLDPADRRLTAGDETWNLQYEEELDAGVELVEQGPGAPRVIRGWAYGPAGAGEPDAVLVFVGSDLAGVVWPERPSREAFARSESKDVRALTAGFEVPLGGGWLDFDAPVTVVVLRGSRALAAQLPPLSGGPS